MITGATIRAKRIQAGIAGHLLCRKVGMPRSRLSGIENQYWAVAPEELARIDASLDALISVKGVLRQTAAELGWPGVEAVIR